MAHYDDKQISRRISLRDLHVLHTVASCRSMAKAASVLGRSQPSVSEAIAKLEQMVGCRLLDRSSRGVDLTIHGEALLRRSRTVFDELEQGFQELQSLSDPGSGSLKLGFPESLASSILPDVLKRFWAKYPRVIVHTVPGSASVLDLPSLRAREIDLFVGLTQHHDGDEELRVERLFDDRPLVAVGHRHPQAKKRKIDFADLCEYPWLLTGVQSRNYKLVQTICASRSLPMPAVVLDSFSVHVRANLLASGPYVTILPRSVFLYNSKRYGLTQLSVPLPSGAWPVAMVTLRNRTPTPVVSAFMEYLRAFVASTELLRD